MKVLDIFSGIGGFSLGFERAGMRTVAFCEIDPYCRRVLARHWPCIRCYDDVRGLITRLRTDGVSADVICGGFPCQDISDAGKRTGISGERSGLWKEFASLIGEILPSYVVVENVAALLGRGLGIVLGDLATLGYDAEWHCIPACAIGATHRRDRIWVVAYPNCLRRAEKGIFLEQRAVCLFGELKKSANFPESGREALSNSNGAGLPDGRQDGEQARHPKADWKMELLESQRRCRAWWESEPDVGRVAARVPSRVDRLRALGNAIVPQIAEMIGRIIMAREAKHVA